jgi:hypothetical protein
MQDSDSEFQVRFADLHLRAAVQQCPVDVGCATVAAGSHRCVGAIELMGVPGRTRGEGGLRGWTLDRDGTLTVTGCACADV